MDRIGPYGLYNMIQGFQDRTAVVRSCVVYWSGRHGDHMIQNRQSLEGTIVSPQGQSGLTWELIFQPNGYFGTFAELPETVRNDLCPRLGALALFRKYSVENIVRAAGPTM